MDSRSRSNNCTYRWSTLGTSFAAQVVVNFVLERLKSSLVLTVTFFLVPVAVAAQGGGLSGNVVLPNGAFLNERARITLLTSRGVKSIVYTDNQGHFQFSGLTPAIYEIVVEPDGDRFETAKAKIEVFAGMPAIVHITLTEKKPSEPNGPATAVSTGELDPAVPSQAKKEFERASNASNSGKTEEAIGHLRKAIALYPTYLMAHNDLGAQLLAQGKLDEAAEQFRRAIQIDSKAFNPCLNLGIVLVQQHQFAEAAETLKTALSLRPNSPAAILYHGLALEGTNDLNGAEKELKTAHDLGGLAYAVALFHLGQIYMNRGEREQARQAFEGYLREAPSGPNAAQARKMIELLR